MKLNDAYMTTPMLTALLAARHPPAEYAFFTQVRAHTGFGDARGTRTADALALSLWPSRGLVLTGYETKISRSDWKREKDNPAKAERIATFCDYWYVVAPTEREVPVDQLPEKWGLLVPNAKRSAFVAVKPALKLKAKPLDRAFVAALLRCVGNSMVSVDVMTEAVNKAREEGKEAAEKHDPDNSRLKQLEKRDQLLQGIEAAAGVYISDWGTTPEDVGQALKLALKTNGELKRVVQRAVGNLRRFHDNLQALQSLEMMQQLERAADDLLAQADKLTSEPPTDNPEVEA